MPQDTSAPLRARRLALTAVGMLALCIVALGVLGVHGCRSELDGAARACSDIRRGVLRADAARQLDDFHVADLGGRLAGPGGPRLSYDYGVRGTFVSWECEIDVDPADRVMGTRLRSWLVMDFHGTWDDRAHDWIERHWL